MATFLIADTHFGHGAIIGMCARPFSDVREMDDTMRDLWNATVRPEDTVVHLGDFAHRYPVERLPRLFASLNGKKHLIKGNHDDKHTLELPWESVRDIGYTSIDSQLLVLCHHALRTWPKIRKGALMLYGHSHGRLPGNVQSCDIGVDVRVLRQEFPNAWFDAGIKRWVLARADYDHVVRFFADRGYVVIDGLKVVAQPISERAKS